MPTAGLSWRPGSRRSFAGRTARRAGTSRRTMPGVRVRKRYVIRGRAWTTVWTRLPKHEIARVRWATKTIELDPSLRTYPRGTQEFILRHEFLHIILRRAHHSTPTMSHGRFVELGMALDNLIHFGKDTFDSRA